MRITKNLFLGAWIFGFDCLQKKEKRRWLFRKSINHVLVQQCEEKIPITNTITSTITAPVSPTVDAEKRHATAVEAASVTAKEAVKIARPASSCFVRAEIWAAIIIQTAFRGYLVSHHLLLYASIFSCLSWLMIWLS